MITKMLAISAALAGAIHAAPALAQGKNVSVVLVHGAFVDGSGWKSVYDILAKQGYEVLIVQNATSTLEDDATATGRVIAAAKHPVVLVGHSYGGAVITLAGDNPKVRSLVYISAFAPDAGESIAQLAEAPTPGEPKAPLLPPQGGYLLVDPEKFPNAFAADVDPAITRFMAAAQVPWGVPAVQAKLGTAAWRSKPTYFLVTTQDHMIPPSAQRVMAARTGGKVIEMRSSHAVMMSHPEEVARFITGAAETGE